MRALLLTCLLVACLPPPPQQVTECQGVLDGVGHFHLVVSVDLADMAVTSAVTVTETFQAVARYEQDDAGWLRAPVEVAVPVCDDPDGRFYFSLDRDAIELTVTRRSQVDMPWGGTTNCARGIWQ